MHSATYSPTSPVIHYLNGWLIHTPAKLNLFFELLSKRPDGYHEIESLMVPISLYDTLVLEHDRTSAIPLSLECRTLPPTSRAAEIIPADERNLVWQAVAALRRIRDLPSGLRLTLCKRIPSQAGLGGGSSDAAATLRLLDSVFNLQLKVAELWALASELGSDVPFFLNPTPQIARGRGENLVPISGLPRLHCVLIAPAVGLATPTVYGRSQIPAQRHRLESLVAALQFGSQSLHGMLWNALEPAARDLCPDILRIAAAVAETSSIGQLMSGSGSSYFGLYANARAAARAARHLQSMAIGQVYQVNS